MTEQNLNPKGNFQSDTPKTDAACGKGNYIHCVDDDFARELEKDNSRLRSALAQLLNQAEEVYQYSSWHNMCKYNKVQDAREAAREILSENK